MQLCHFSMTISEKGSSRWIKLIPSLAKEPILGTDKIAIRDSPHASTFWSYLQGLVFFGIFHRVKASSYWRCLYYYRYHFKEFQQQLKHLFLLERIWNTNNYVSSTLQDKKDAMELDICSLHCGLNTCLPRIWLGKLKTLNS